jgi:predicted acetyltransferase
MRSRLGEVCAVVELMLVAKEKPPEMGRPAGRNSFNMQSRVYRSAKLKGGILILRALCHEPTCGML